MKSKIILFFLLVLSASVGHSQILISALFGDKLNSEGLEFGLEGGVNWSSISDIEADKRLSSFNLGFYFDIRLKNEWNFYTGVLVKGTLGVQGLSSEELESLGIQLQQEEGTYSQYINYFMIPALLKYNFPNRIYLEAGPQFGLNYRARVEFSSESEDREIRIRDFNRKAINTFDAGLTFGFGYKLMDGPGMTLGIKYYTGLTNVYNNRPGTKNNALFLKANIPIGANKAAKKDEANY